MPSATTAPQRASRSVGAPRGTRRAMLIAGLVALAAAVTVVARQVNIPHNYFDLRIYLAAMRWWRGGHPLYDFSQPDLVQGALGFTYPPFAALILRPLAVLGTTGSIYLFLVVNAAALFASTYLLVSPVADRRGWPRWYVAVAAALACAVLEPVRETFSFGQINLLLVVLVVADLLVAVPRGSRWAGVGIGLATAIKLTPGIFIVYLLVCRRWRAAAVASATSALATLLAAAVFPKDSWQFWTGALWDTDRVGHLERVANQSLLGTLSRLAYPAEPAHLLWPVLALAALGYGLWRAARAGRSGDHLAGLTLTGTVGVLVSPVSWSHHLYWFIPALVILADVASSRDEPPVRRIWTAWLAALCFTSLMVGVPGWYDGMAQPPPWDANLFTQLVAGWYVVLLVVLLVVLPIRPVHRIREVTPDTIHSD